MNNIKVRRVGSSTLGVKEIGKGSSTPCKPNKGGKMIIFVVMFIMVLVDTCCVHTQVCL